MKILVVGGGGREHAIIKKLRENLEVREVYALPGNGGISLEAVCKPIGAKELEKIRDFASQRGRRPPICLSRLRGYFELPIPAWAGQGGGDDRWYKGFRANEKVRRPTASYEVTRRSLKREVRDLPHHKGPTGAGKGVVGRRKGGALDAIRPSCLPGFGESGSAS